MRQTLRSIAERLDKYARSVSFFASQQATGATTSARSVARAAAAAVTTTTSATTATSDAEAATTLAGVSPKEDKRILPFFGGIYNTVQYVYNTICILNSILSEAGGRRQSTEIGGRRPETGRRNRRPEAEDRAPK